MTNPAESPSDKIDYPATFQDDQVGAVARNIGKGECASVVGVGTMGKTWFIKRLHHPRVLQHYYYAQGQAFHQKKVLFVPIDPNALSYVPDEIELRIWAGFELILSSIINHLLDEDDLKHMQPDETRKQAIKERKDLATTIGKEFYAALFHTSPLYRYVAMRQLEDAIDLLAKSYNAIILVFDEFELLWDSMPAEFFTNLRSLRDLFRYKLLYVVVSRTEILRLDQRNLKVSDAERQAALRKKAQTESFLELFRRTVYMSPPQTELSARQQQAGQQINDARLLTQNLNARLRAQPLSGAATQLLWNVTDRHSGLMRTVLQGFDDRYVYIHEKHGIIAVMQELLKEPDIVRELEILYMSLTEVERKFLLELVKPQKPFDAILNDYQLAADSLKYKSIFLKYQDGRGNVNYYIQPPLLAQYLIRYDDFNQIRNQPMPSTPNTPPRPPTPPDLPPLPQKR